MATTQNTFTGDGSNLGPFSFTFKWLELTDIKVTVAGVLKTAGTHYNLQGLNYATKTGGQVLFTAGNAPANGAAIIIYRETDDSDLAATFYSGSAIRAQDLNNNFIQGLYVTQESSNNAAAATTAANAATTTANTALSNSTAAQASAASAISTANSAVSTANSAVSTANSAVSTANSASAAAASAVSTANTANSTASSALSAVSEALAYTTVANVAAIPGSPTNGDSLRITDSTGIESFTPLIGVPGGFVGNSALTVEIYYNGTSSTWIWSRYFPNDPENRYWAGSVVVSDTAPLSPTDDSLWYDSIGGRFYIWYNDGNTSQWVDASPQGNLTSTFLAGTAALPGLTPVSDTNTGIYSPGADQVAISTNGTRRLLIDSAGALTLDTGDATIYGVRVGRGAGEISTSTALGSGALNANTTGDNTTALGYRALYVNTTGTQNTAVGSLALASNTTGQWNTALGVAALNTSNGSNNTAVGRVSLYFNTSGVNNTGVGYQSLYNNSTGSSNVCIGVSSGSSLTTGSNNTIIGSIAGTAGLSDTVIIGAGSTERLRIDSSGRLLVGTSLSFDNSAFVQATSTSGLSTAFAAKITTSNTASVFSCNNSSNSYVGGINVSSTATAFATSSDYRLKENVVAVTDGITRLQQLKPSRFNFIADPDQTVDGFLAHEVQTVVPEAIFGEKDAVNENGDPIYQSIDQAKLVPLLTAALQEAIGRIETLQGMVAVNNMTIDEQHYQISALADRLTTLEGGTN
jgi:hypothetical protein